MKKILAVTLACIMVLTFAIGTSAATPTPDDVQVGVEVNPAPDYTEVSVDWTSLDFTYVFNRTWNPTEHDEDVVEGWAVGTAENVDRNTVLSDSVTATLTVTNHSNKDVNIAASYVPATLSGDVETQFANVNVALGDLSKTTLEDAVGTTVDSATATLTVSGKPTESNREAFPIGTISVSVS